MITCPSCGEEEDLAGDRLPDGRLQGPVRCLRTLLEPRPGHAAPDQAPPAPTPKRPVAAGSSGAQVNERATAAVIAELERRGARCRAERVGTNRREILARADAHGPEIAVVLRARARGAWQTRASYRLPRQPEQHPTRFCVFVDLGRDGPVLLVHPSGLC